MTRSVVVGWTPDEYGAAALEHAVAEARDRGARLVVVNGTKGDSQVDDRFAGEQALGTLESRLAEEGVPHEVRQVVGGDVGDQVVAVADELDADLVVVALRRRTPVGKLLMGRVAQRILLGAGCPVLAVKPGTAPRR
ncbi:MAG: universal stress protein [Nocardioides sp.]|nr:universal stress protein [Nocardioides sp.]